MEVREATKQVLWALGVLSLWLHGFLVPLKYVCVFPHLGMFFKYLLCARGLFRTDRVLASSLCNFFVGKCFSVWCPEYPNGIS